MPIYAYRCDSCGHASDVLQKLSDPLLSACPSCGNPTFSKQVTAAGFQLKGSGWYATDFKSGQTHPKQDPAKPQEGATPDATRPEKASTTAPDTTAAGITGSSTPSGATSPAAASDSVPATR